jgi:hypothetical protein
MKFLKSLPVIGNFAEKIDEKFDELKFDMKTVK